jgi:hypothetical protein
VKTAYIDNDKMCLDREYRNYKIQEIAACPYIRALYDTVPSPIKPEDDTSCLVFEWMDQSLATMTAPELRKRPILPKVVSSAVLSALAVLKLLNAAHTGIKATTMVLLCSSPMLHPCRYQPE